MEWTGIDADSTLCMRADVAMVEVEGEVVLYDPTNSRSEVLNPTAGLVWRLLDGSVSLRDLAVDLASVYDVPILSLEQDLVELGRSFGRLGLLVGINGEKIEQPAPDDCA